MFQNPSLVTRIAIGKGLGFIFGTIGFFLLPYLLPEVSLMFRWGILLWYVTLGAFIGMFGVFTHHPVLGLPFPWWIRSSYLGAWMNFLLVLFTYDEMSLIMITIFGENGFLSSPFWFILDGAIAGLIIGYFATKFGGEGKASIYEVDNI